MRLLTTLLIFSAGHLVAIAETHPSVDRLASLLTGVFSSAEQAIAERGYRHVVLHVVPVWTQRTDGPWLYVEQALAEAIDQPYRQRIYQLARSDDGTLESRVFTLADPITATGAWRQPNPLATVSPADLTHRDGCTVFLTEQADGTFHGRTQGNGCASELRGASYATSEVVLYPNRMISWDRGFNAAGVQVWGASAGGYIFKRIE